MAAPVVPDPTFSALYDDASKWTHPTLDYEYYTERVGAPNPTTTYTMDRPATVTTLVNLATRTPTLVAFVPANDNDAIYIRHSLTIYPSDPVNTLPFDNEVIALLGDDPNAMQPLVLGETFFRQNCMAVRCKRADYNIGTDQLTHAPPILCSGPHGTTEPDVDELYFRPAMLMPVEEVTVTLTTNTDGIYSYLAFYNTFLAPAIGSGNADLIRKYTPLVNWWRCACTAVTGGGSVVEIDPGDPGNLCQRCLLDGWVSRSTNALIHRLGYGGPALTSAAFTAGVEVIRTTISDTNMANLEYDRAKSHVTFTDRFGDALAQRLRTWTSVASDADLPEIHRVLLRSRGK